MKLAHSDAKFVVVGSGGQLGRELQCSGIFKGTLVALTREQLNITDRQSVKPAIASIKPDSIINAAAFTSVDKAEAVPEVAYQINKEGAGHLAETAFESGARLAQISTDYVFDGSSPVPYRPDDLPNPINVYGQSKLAGERIVLETMGDKALIVRATRLYSKKGPSVLSLMFKLLQEKSDLYMLNDQFSATTRVSGLFNVIFSAAQKNVSGIHHWTDFGVSSWYDFACATRDHLIGLGLSLKTKNINPISSKDYSTPA